MFCECRYNARKMYGQFKAHMLGMDEGGDL